MTKKPIFFIKIFVVFAVVLFFILYFFHQSRAFLSGPDVVIEYPQNGQTVENSLILVKGRATNISSLLVNGQVVFTDSFGNFERNLLLARGYNIIDLTAKDKFGREVTKKLQIVLK